MDWKEAAGKLADVAVKLAFKQELIDALRGHAKQANPPAVLLAQIEVILSVAKQNQRAAQLHGYPGLETYAKQVEVACQNLVGALRNAGVQTQKTAQAQTI